MRPGLTASPSSHKAGFPCPALAGDARRNLLILWTICSVLTGGAVLQTGADQISTTATSDGSVMSSSARITGDSIITGRLFGYGPTTISRETETDPSSSPGSGVNARSEGTLLIGEYASVSQKKTEKPLTCVFGNRSLPETGTEYRIAGTLQQANYSHLQTLRPYESDITASGTGMIDLRHRLTGNETLSGRTFATGNLSVTEEIRREYLP